jgi:C4-dicarboxylate transporter DctM subunit
VTPLIIGIIGIIVAFVFIFLRMPVAIALLGSGFLGLWYLKGSGPALNIIATVPFSTMSMYVWTTVPLFVLMGYLAERTGLAEEFYDGIGRWIGHFRGGLATTVIIGNTAFGACTGDAISASVTFLTVSLPVMRKHHYADSLTLGTIAAGSLLAVLIPPSLPFILIGALTQTSIGALFIAGILPGLILMFLYIACIYVLCWRNPALGPRGPVTTFREKIGAARGMWGLIIMFVVIIGGLYLGVFSPTEAGAAGAFVVFIIGIARKRLTWQRFKGALRSTGETVPLIGLLVVGTMVFNRFLVMSGLTVKIVDLLVGFTDSPLVFLLIIVGVYLILGCFLDSLSLTLLSVPILFPVVQSLGIDILQFGVVFVTITALGTLTPPFGIVVFAMAGAAKDVPLYSIFRGVAPFILIVLICCILFVLFPQISTFLPGTMKW